METAIYTALNEKGFLFLSSANFYFKNIPLDDYGDRNIHLRVRRVPGRASRGLNFLVSRHEVLNGTPVRDSHEVTFIKVTNRWRLNKLLKIINASNEFHIRSENTPNL